MTQQTALRAPAQTKSHTLDITVRAGSGTGRTRLSAFDRALQGAGVADLNLVTLSSVIPAQSQITRVEADTLEAAHGDVLFCVRSEAYADRPGDSAWAGLGWCVDETGAGLFVEHHGGSERSVVEQIQLSLDDMKSHRDAPYGEVQMALTSAHCVDFAVCAVVVAAYQVSSWPDLANDSPRPAGAALPSKPGSNGTSASYAAAARPTPASLGAGPALRITREKELDYDTARRFYGLYHQTFRDLETRSPARQLLHESEFLEEMIDSKVEKWVAWDEDGRAIGLSTLTSSLEAVPWISPAYFAEHYPDHYARGVVFYLGFTLVDRSRQGSHVFRTILKEQVDRVVAERGVTAWDICHYNDERGLGTGITRMLEEFADITVDQIDSQHYYAGIFHGPR